MNYSINEIRKNVYLIESDSQYSITSMFMRPQEYYESPFKEIRGKYFSVEKYMDIYASENGNFTYNSDWSGFNIPSEVFKSFYEIFSYDLTLKENLLLNMVKSINANLKGTFYIIGTIKGRNKVINHELAHAYWYLDVEYAAKMVEFIRDFQRSAYELALDGLRSQGYNMIYANDEFQAYMATSSRSHLIRYFNWDKIKNLKVPQCFKRFFQEYDSAYK